MSRLFAVASLAMALAAPSFASDCPPPGSSPLGESTNQSWSDYLTNLILDLILGPSLPYQPMECTDVEIFFD